MSTTVIKLSKWIMLAFLAIILISIIAVQVEPHSSEVTSRIQAIDSDSSETISRIDTTDSGFIEVTPQIEAIIISGSGDSIISVGGKLLREGDTVNGFKILTIHPNRVQFEKDGRIVEGVFPPARKSIKPKSNNLIQKPVNWGQVGFKSSDNYQKQYRPVHRKPFVPENMGESRWRVFETTTIDGRVRKIRKGTIFKTLSKNIYEVAEIIFLFEMEVRPDVTVLTDGQFHKLLIEGVEEPLLCTKLNRGIRNICSVGRVIEALVINEFDGLEHGKIFKLDNGQIWEQEEFYIYTGIFIMPKVTIWHNGVVFKMKIDGVDKPVTVQQLY